MFKDKLNKAEINIIRLFPHEQMTISQIADKLDIDISWASKCVSHLEYIGLMMTEKINKELYAKMPDTSVGTALSSLLIEEPAMNLHTLLGNSSLQILPLLLPPGYSTKAVSKRTGLSFRTIQTNVRKWRGMGLVVLEDDNYHLNHRHQTIITFVQEYSKHRNLRHLRENNLEATIVWQDRDEYIISLDHEMNDDRYSPAGATNIGLRGYDIISRNYYYHYCPLRVRVGEAEALVQTVRFDPINPRPIRYIKQALRENKVTRNEIRKYAKKYGVRKRVEEAL
jgi:hypothetical protein